MRLLVHLALLAVFLCGAPSMAVPLTSSAADANEGDDGWASAGTDDDKWTSAGTDGDNVNSSDVNAINSNETSSFELIDFNGTGCVIEQVVEVIELKRIVIYQLTDAGELLLLSGDDGSSTEAGDDDNENSEFPDHSPFFGLRSDTAVSKHNKTVKAKPKKTQPKKVHHLKASTRADSTAKSNSSSPTAGDKPKNPTPAGNGTCTPAAVCQSSEDCGGGKARCIGVAVGTCNCGACIGGLLCKTDAECGGLQNACSDKGICDCVGAAHKSKGFVSIANTLRTFCNHKKCDADEDGCFGLPCHTGLCAC